MCGRQARAIGSRLPAAPALHVAAADVVAAAAPVVPVATTAATAVAAVLAATVAVAAAIATALRIATAAGSGGAGRSNGGAGRSSASRGGAAAALVAAAAATIAMVAVRTAAAVAAAGVVATALGVMVAAADVVAAAAITAGHHPQELERIGLGTEAEHTGRDQRSQQTALHWRDSSFQTRRVTEPETTDTCRRNRRPRVALGRMRQPYQGCSATIQGAALPQPRLNLRSAIVCSICRT